MQEPYVGQSQQLMYDLKPTISIPSCRHKKSIQYFFRSFHVKRKNPDAGHRGGVNRRPTISKTRATSTFPLEPPVKSL